MSQNLPLNPRQPASFPATTMQSANSFKLVLLKQMLLGFRLSAGPSSRGMTLQERKSAIKLSADAAMALARGRTRWTHGLIASLSKEEKNRAFLRCILGGEYEKLLARPCQSSWKIPRCKKIVTRSFRSVVCSVRKKNLSLQHHVKASALARSIVRKKSQVLRKLVPGGELLDGFSLLGETLDYVISLRAQVDLLQHLLNAGQISKPKREVIHSLASEGFGRWNLN